LLPAREPLVFNRSGARLTVRLASVESGEHLLLLQLRSLARQAEALSLLGLTRREAQVLALLSDGKTDAQIALDLGPSERTIQKHVEHIFRKLSVETRIAAALRARDFLD
jgi:DNA-binding NarL/FixJ family response regulator